jgi:hypothetical protein
MEEDPGPGLDKTLLGVLAPGSHHVLAERFDMTKIGAGPKVRDPGLERAHQGCGACVSSAAMAAFCWVERSHCSVADVGSCCTLAATPSVSGCCCVDSFPAGALVFRSKFSVA